MNIYLIISTPELKLTSEQKSLLESVGSVKIISHKGKLSDIQELKQDMSEKVIGLDPDVVEWNVDPSEFDLIQNVKAICTQSTSFGWLNGEALKEKGIAIYNVPGFSTDSVAEYAIALAIESARRLPLHLKNMSLDWNTEPMLLKGKKLGVVGLGAIGKRIAEIGKGIGMEVLYWSQHTRDDRFTFSELQDLFASADLLIPALKDNEQTKTIITHELIDTLKLTAIVIGIGGVKKLFDEKYIISKVEAGKLGGYACEGDNVQEISSQGNVWAVPAIAWYTKDSLESLIEGWVKNIAKAAQDLFSTHLF